MTPRPRLMDQVARSVRDGLDATLESVRATTRPMQGRETVPEAEGAEPAVAASPLDPPRIVLDGVFFQLHNSGVTRLWKALMAEWSASGFARHIVVLDRLGTAPRLPGFTYRTTIPFRYYDSFAQRVALERICRAEEADLFVSTYYSLPTGTRSLLYVYDMIPEVLGFDLGQRMWREKRRAIEHASAYVAISQNTASDLRRFYPDTADRPLRVAHCAAEALFTPASETEVSGLLGHLGLPPRYFLFVGTRNAAYKNAALVLNALALLPAGDRPAMMFVGESPELEPDLTELVGDTRVRVAALSDNQLRVAYSGALGLLYPSRYEGFGIPILEAMACGCPVVTVRSSSIPEVAGDAALYLPTDTATDLAAAMELLLDESVRRAYRAKGFERARLFDWKTPADEVESFIRQMLERREAVPPAAAG
jgi:glycosyltransferase involved in cell wall biosynthesis